MFFPLFLFSLIILSLVSVSSFSLLQTQENSAKLISSTAAFYAAESSLEDSLYQIKQNKVSEDLQRNSLIRSFALEKKDLSQKTGDISFDDYDISIVERDFSDKTTTLDDYEAYGSFDEFRFLDTENHFSSLEFFYHKSGEIFNDGILIDIIRFPRVYFESEYDQTTINFGSVQNLSTKYGDTGKNICRFMYHSLMEGAKKIANPQNCENIPIFQAGSADSVFQESLQIWGFDTFNWNYIIRFRSINNTKIHYKILANYNGDQTSLALTNQLLEIDSETETENMFQRIKVQQRSFAPLQPGLDFVLFSDKSISK